MHDPLSEAIQSVIVCIKFVPPVSGLRSSVEAQTSATCASVGLAHVCPNDISSLHATPKEPR